MITDNLWFWLALGLLPYMIERSTTPAPGTTLTIRALFWEVQVERALGRRTHWKMRVILIERLREAVWAAIARLRGEGGG